MSNMMKYKEVSAIKKCNKQRNRKKRKNENKKERGRREKGKRRQKKTRFLKKRKEMTPSLTCRRRCRE